MTEGVVFDIEEFGVFDGPGIRTLVFLKGCNLKCTWCQNPEGISFSRQLVVSVNSCISCGRCKVVCPGDVCTACGKCTDVCPLRLRKICGTIMGPKELAAKININSRILRDSGGGVTFSGGEPLLQPAFVFETVGYLGGLHTAIETSGFVDAGIFRQAVDMIDLILFDIKHTDAQVHKKYTGSDNHLILQNLEYLKNSGKTFRVRIPLIPGVNDSEENMEKTARMLAGVKNLERVDLLPFNKAAGAKYKSSGMIFNPGFDVDAACRVHQGVFEKYNIRSDVQ